MTATRATPLPIIAPPSSATDTLRCIADRSGPRETCLIRWTRTRRSRLNPLDATLTYRILLRGRTCAGHRAVVDLLGAELFRARPANDRGVSHQRLRTRRGVGARPGESASRHGRDLVVSDDAPRSGPDRLHQSSRPRRIERCLFPSGHVLCSWSVVLCPSVVLGAW